MAEPTDAATAGDGAGAQLGTPPTQRGGNRDRAAAQAEERLETTESRLRVLADSLAQIIWTNTAEGKADYFNRRWFEFTGLTYEESAGDGWEAVVHPDDA